jgi:hypothetical protein
MMILGVGMYATKAIKETIHFIMLVTTDGYGPVLLSSFGEARTCRDTGLL